ncbi:hypothetical protein CYMTET_38781 [Cymbomonas tetramitiformis]|uniref:Uncharacterized protein n=1 Tax=Cymbomonas tetramitiformis TaxID=36881 RepID=A0AAE0CCR4_9CHLO|nr:hypothetical protein CYMTET_38781 [Cymbomonas tetramitiformis]
MMLDTSMIKVLQDKVQALLSYPSGEVTGTLMWDLEKQVFCVQPNTATQYLDLMRCTLDHAAVFNGGELLQELQLPHWCESTGVWAYQLLRYLQPVDMEPLTDGIYEDWCRHGLERLPLELVPLDSNAKFYPVDDGLGGPGRVFANNAAAQEYLRLGENRRMLKCVNTEQEGHTAIRADAARRPPPPQVKRVTSRPSAPAAGAGPSRATTGPSRTRSLGRERLTRSNSQPRAAPVHSLTPSPTSSDDRLVGNVRESSPLPVRAAAAGPSNAAAGPSRARSPSTSPTLTNVGSWANSIRVGRDARSRSPAKTPPLSPSPTRTPPSPPSVESDWSAVQNATSVSAQSSHSFLTTGEVEALKQCSNPTVFMVKYGVDRCRDRPVLFQLDEYLMKEDRKFTQLEFRSLLASADECSYFVELASNLLSAHGWSSKTSKFYKGKLNIRALVRSFKQLVDDYQATTAKTQALACLKSDANNVEGFKRGVAGIHRITITYVRTKAFNLLIKTYETDEVYICEWFCDYWWGKWGGWVLGALPPGKPSTQNSPECYNRWSKHSFCNGKQVLLAPFHQHALKFVREDTIYDREFPSPTGPIVRHAVWREALLMVDSNVLELVTKATHLPHLPNNDTMVYVLPTMKTYPSLTSTTTIDKRKEIALLAATFLYLIRDPENPLATVPTFNEYVALYNFFVMVLPSATPEGYVHYACNCPEFHESAVCADLVAVGLFKGKFKAPLGKQLDLIGRVPQPGRPLKPASALHQSEATSRQAYSEVEAASLREKATCRGR